MNYQALSSRTIDSNISASAVYLKMTLPYRPKVFDELTHDSHG